MRAKLNSLLADPARDQSEEGIEALRTSLMQPLDDAFLALLGKDGIKAFEVYERASYYGPAFVSPISGYLPSVGVPLTDDQVDALGSVIAINDHPFRRDAASASKESSIDWDHALLGASAYLTPEQLSALRAYIENKKKKPGG